MTAIFPRRLIRSAGRLSLGLGILLIATGCTANQATPAPSPTTAVAPTSAVISAPSPQAAVSPLAGAAASPSPTVSVYWPLEVEIPSIEVKAPIVHVGLEPDGAMEAPNGPSSVGWYTGSVAPGVAGNALLTAHVDWLDRSTGEAQEAVFWDLHKVQLGDKVVLHSEEDQTFTYTVTESILVAFDDPDALKYLQPTDEAILTLITCEGDFDQATRNYDLRRIVVAERAG